MKNYNIINEFININEIMEIKLSSKILFYYTNSYKKDNEFIRLKYDKNYISSDNLIDIYIYDITNNSNFKVTIPAGNSKYFRYVEVLNNFIFIKYDHIDIILYNLITKKYFSIKNTKLTMVSSLMFFKPK